MAEESLENKDHEKKESKAEEILEHALERFKLSADADREIRKDALEDLEFRAGKQWPDEIKFSREQDRRPCLVVNRVPQFVRQITNDQRQNRPSIKVNPVDDQADVETAKVYQGLIRHIEYISNADVAYDTAFDAAVTHGRGFFRIISQYSDPLSFKQELIIKRIRNPFMVYPDPSMKEPDGSDMNWCFIAEDLQHKDYKEQYPDSKCASLSDFESLGDRAPTWMSGDHVRVAEYFVKDFQDKKILLLSNGQVVAEDELNGALPEGIEIVQSRVTKVPVIKWYKINAVEILEEGIWPGQHIPVIPVLGEELDVNGKLILAGVVRNAKDPQRMYNYFSSSEAEMIALAPRAPFIAAEGQFEGHEAQWKTANIKNHAYLEYKPVSLNGQMAPPPQRQVYEAPVQAITMARANASEEIKSTTGIYDAALGARSNENSGVAIQRRNQQSQTSNFHFVDNLTRSIRHAGKILVDVIPHIYDTPTTARIIGEDGEQELVKINQVFIDGKTQKIHDLSAGKYDVTVDTGPSYATKRQEAAASIIELTKVAPQVAQVASDLMVRNMDWPGATEIADRLKKTLPPGIADNKEMDQPLPPQVKAQMDQMSQMVEALTQQLHAAQDKLENKTLELESKERIENMKTQAQIEIEMAKLGSVEAITLLKTEIAQIEQRLNLLNQHVPIADDEGSESPQQEYQEHNLGSEPQEAFEQQPTGGFSPGNNSMEQS